MIKLQTLIATWFGSGFMTPASGTWGTLAALPVCLLITTSWGLYGVIFGAMTLFIIGLWATYYYQIETGEHDSSHIVIDEAAGMMVACIPLLYSFDWGTIIVCFLLFRIFDAIKVGPVGWLDKNIGGALGVMIDDIAAGLMATLTILGFFIWMI